MGVVAAGRDVTGVTTGAETAGGCSAGAGATVGGKGAGMAAGSTAGSGSGAAAGVDWTAARAAWAVEETNAPTPPAALPVLPLTDETADEMLLPKESDRWEVSASAAGADTASHATAAAPANRTGRKGRSTDRDKAAMVMLNTPPAHRITRRPFSA